MILIKKRDLINNKFSYCKEQKKNYYKKKISSFQS